MLSAVIIDDERSSRETLELLLEKFHPEVRVDGLADSAASGKEAIQKWSPDLVFLDVNMPGGSGFDLLTSLPEIDFEVIFVTAHSHHAMRAFQFAALHFIRKPVEIKELRAGVDRAKEAKDRDQELMKSQFETLKASFSNPGCNQVKVALPSLEGFSFEKLEDIVRIKGNDSYSDVYFADGRKLIVSRKVSQLERMLKGCRFFRIHRSHLINLDHLVRYIRGRGGEVEMSDGAFIDVSRRKKAEFLEAIMAP